MAAPVNDDFANRILLSGSTFNQAGTNVDATLEAEEPIGESSGEASVWYEWVAPNDGFLALEIISAVISDSTLAVFTGEDTGSLVLVAFDDDGGVGYLSAIKKVAVTFGRSYKISVMGYGASDVGAFTLTGVFSTSPTIGNLSKLYAGFKSDVLTKQIDFSTDEIRVAILNTSYAPSLVDDVVFSDVSSFEISGAGYDAGGKELLDVTVTADANGTIKIDATDLSWSGLTASNPGFLVLYDVTNGNSLIGYINFCSLAYQPANDSLNVVWDTTQNAVIEVYCCQF